MIHILFKGKTCCCDMNYFKTTFAEISWSHRAALAGSGSPVAPRRDKWKHVSAWDVLISFALGTGGQGQ